MKPILLPVKASHSRVVPKVAAICAQFSDISVRTGPDGKKGVCGFVNAKNGFGGLTGGLPFVFDGDAAWIIIFNTEVGDPTRFTPDVLGVIGEHPVKVHDAFCENTAPVTSKPSPPKRTQ
jgi:hypothetical protein